MAVDPRLVTILDLSLVANDVLENVTALLRNELPCSCASELLRELVLDPA